MEDDDQPPTFEELLLLEELLESGQLSDDDLLDVDIPTMDFLSMEQQMNQFRDDEASQAEVWYLSDDDNNVDYEAMHNVYDEHIHSDIISSYFQNMQPSETSNTNRNHGKKTFELSDNQRAVMVAKLMLLANKDMTLPWGVAKKLANEYGVDKSTVHRIWGRAKDQMQQDVIDVRRQKKGRVGRKAREFTEEVIKNVPKRHRTTLRSFAIALQTSPSTIYRLLKKGILRPHTNSIKPSVTAAHKTQRIQWILSKIIPRTVHSGPKFSSLYNVIHIDEKWFYMSRKTQRYYLLAGEEEPYRATQNSNYLVKVMFLCGIARPIIGYNGEVLFDGKLGIFPFTEEVPAKRSSKNRERGTIEIKAITSVTKEVIRRKIIDELLPAIRSKWPWFASKDILIQQDNARPHINRNDAEFLDAATQEGFNIQLICQPPQSPDLNVLDLGFFRAIQSLQHQKFPRDVEALVKAVKEAYEAYDPKLINYTWLQLQYVMLEILGVKGGNNYKSPHKGKAKMDNLGLLPDTVEVPDDLLTSIRQYMQEGQININEFRQRVNEMGVRVEDPYQNGRHQ
ncbi:uncharacterized protein [Spinacia oleracea]|uniref:Transposase n=1 Tax=Spinacia oleracea TaxID=3562 RepID=A0A9R0K7R7_SPIOL|nr:uncharacterized protein LOC110800636 [Spinacia oleracea]